MADWTFLAEVKSKVEHNAKIDRMTRDGLQHVHEITFEHSGKPN